MSFGSEFPQQEDLELLHPAERVMAQRLWREAGGRWMLPGALPFDTKVELIKASGMLEPPKEKKGRYFS